MEQELINEYLKRFDKAFSLLKNNDNFQIIYIELTKEFLHCKKQEFADALLQDVSTDTEVFTSGALIFYGYRLGVTRLKGINQCLTRQSGYSDNAIWSYDLDSILNVTPDDDNPDSGVSHIIEWSINPGSNTDVSEVVIGKMMIPMVQNICKITPPGKRTECTIVVPPISKEIEIQNWPDLFVGITGKNLRINIVNYGHLLDIKEDERKYVIQYQTDGFKEYVIVSAYEVIRGHNICLGSMAFDVNDFDHQYELQDINPISFTIDNCKNTYQNSKEVNQKNDWEYQKCINQVDSGFNSFLGNNSDSFGREFYKLSGVDDNIDSDSDAIKSVFNGNEALQIIEVCTRLIGQKNLYNIALGDLVYVANILHKNNNFNMVSIGTTKEHKLGTYKHFAFGVDIDRLYEIPSNYNNFSWRLKDKRKKLIPYFSLNAKNHDEKQIIESIVDHFEHCTTSIIADELLYLYKDGEDPSAFFVAKVFMYISQMDSLEIESRNDIVTSIENVDDIEFKEVDKTSITILKSSDTEKQNNTLLKQHNELNKVLRMTIEEMDFTVRTYNCLRRAGFKTVFDIIKISKCDIKKIRNLNAIGQQELSNKIFNLGLQFNGE